MKKWIHILIAWVIALAGFLIYLLNFHLGIVAVFLIFWALAFVPGFLTLNFFKLGGFSFLDIYLLSLSLGLSIFMIVGLPLFLIRAPLESVNLLMFILNSLLFLGNCIFVAGRSRKDRRDTEGVGVYALVVLFTVIASFLGAFRGWGEDWDYYTYIAMVKRLVSKGIIDNYPLAYANEAVDPIHGFNVWALLWASVAKSASVTPVFLYVKSAFLTVPAALCSFYFASKALFSKPIARLSLFCYAIFHLFGMGMILMGRSSFYNDDPAWLIFFPTLIGIAIRFVREGRKIWLIISALLSSATWLLHPLWGVLVFIFFGVGIVGNLFVRDGRLSGKVKVSAAIGVVVFFFPVLYVLVNLFAPWSFNFELPSLKWGTLLFLGIPLILFSLWLYEKAHIVYRDMFFRRWFLLSIISFLAASPFIILRLFLISGTHENGALLSPYKFFVSGALFVLSPFNFTYTAPDMTVFPFSLLGLSAIPLLIKRGKFNERNSVFILLGLLVIPLVAFHPYLAYWFVEWAHIAYLRRALRFGAMFASFCSGVTVTWLVERFALRRMSLVQGAVLVALGSIVWGYPYSPPYFRKSFDKALFIMFHASSRGLFWHPEYDVYKSKNAVWDTEPFEEVLAPVKDGETVFSDRFTSYRLTAYRDIYVVCRFKPSQSVRDQPVREKDQARFFAEKSNENRCRILKKYHARWVLLNTDPDYRVDDYYLGDPWTAQELARDGEKFRVVKQVDNWFLFRAESACW